MGFLELVVIAIVGLLVVGPEKLPDTIKVGVVWISRIKRMINNTKNEIEQQIGMDEIRRELHNEEVLESLNSIKKHSEEFEYKSRSAEELVSDVNQRLREEKLEDLNLGNQIGNHGPKESAVEDNSTNK